MTRRIVVTPHGEVSERIPRERCYCGAEDCPACRPGCCTKPTDEDPDDAHDRMVEERLWPEAQEEGD